MEPSLGVLVGLSAIGLVGVTFLVISSFKKQNGNLRERIDNNEGRMRAIFQNAAAEIYLKDTEGRYLMINPQFEKLFNVKNSDVVGLLPTDIHDPELGTKTRAHDLLVLNDRKTVVRDELALTELGIRSLHTIKFPTFDSAGELTGLGAIVSDVTDLRRTEQELRQSQKMDAIGQMAGGIAHDFNNLLAVIQGHLELHELLEDEVERQECIQTALMALQSGADLTKNLLSFAKKSPLSPKATNITELVNETKKWSSRVIPKNIKFSMVQNITDEQICIDKSMAQSAILNIILNSKDAMPHGGEIEIETFNLDVDAKTDLAGFPDCEQGKYVGVKISDTGAGISEADIESVFTPFYTTKPVGSGSGLGLSMVQGFLKQSGGHVAITSELRAGTVVTLLFPKYEEPTDLVTALHDGTRRQPKRSARILFAEDNDDVRHSITRFLELDGHEVTSAPTGDAAFSMFADGPEKFDILVSDILMPGQLQGPDLASRVRSLSPRFPVVFLSGYPRSEVIDGGDYLSGDIYLMKPVAAKKLQETVRRCLGF